MLRSSVVHLIVLEEVLAADVFFLKLHEKLRVELVGHLLDLEGVGHRWVSHQRWGIKEDRLVGCVGVLGQHRRQHRCLAIARVAELWRSHCWISILDVIGHSRRI